MQCREGELNLFAAALRLIELVTYVYRQCDVWHSAEWVDLHALLHGTALTDTLDPGVDVLE